MTFAAPAYATTGFSTIQMLPPTDCNPKNDHRVYGVLGWDGEHSLSCPDSQFVIKGGNVGIGTTSPQSTLDVAGGIHVGSATTDSPCTTEGTFAYDYFAHAPVYCNSRIWVAFGASGGANTRTSTTTTTTTTNTITGANGDDSVSADATANATAGH